MSSVLVWTSELYTLPAAAEDIGDVYNSIVSELPTLGYSGITHTAAGVWGYDSSKDLGISVFFPYNGGKSFWQIVVCGGGGNGAQAPAELDKVKAMISGLKFL